MDDKTRSILAGCMSFTGSIWLSFLVFGYFNLLAVLAGLLVSAVASFALWHVLRKKD